jgi:ribosomal protein S18 acetylase RimI-like enzyme
MIRNLKENACYDNSDLYRLVRYSIQKMKDDEIDELLKKARREDNYFIFGYYENDSIVGLMIYKIEKSSAIIDVISVEKDERGKGIGTQLLKEVHDKYTNIKIEAKCELKAIAFYKKLGFTVQSIGKNYYDEDEFHCWIEYKSDL